MTSLAAKPRGWTPWRTVLVFGVVSLAADMVYEGMRSVSGPLLASLGASAFTVGLVTGAGEAAALLFRLASGPYADRSGQHWRLTFLGYGLTAVCVPLLAFTPFLGAAGLAVASVLILLERTGKAIRSPSKSALLADVAKHLGRGRGFGVHKALDQVGAFAGPLLMTAAIAITGVMWPGFALLAIPGAAAMVLLVVLRHRAPGLDKSTQPTTGQPDTTGTQRAKLTLPARFHAFAISCALGTFGLMTYGVISYHLVHEGLVHAAAVPLIYAAAMAISGVAALATGEMYDRFGARTLYVLPVLIACVPALSLSPGLGLVLAGVAVWAVVGGIQDSTIKALVADLVSADRLATAYGIFAAWQGVAALAGGAIAGGLYTNHRAVLIGSVVAIQVVSLALLVITLHNRTSSQAPDARPG